MPFADDLTGYVVGASGAVLKTTDGAAWVARASNTSGTHGIAFVDATTGYAVGAAAPWALPTRPASSFGFRRAGQPLADATD